MSDYDKIARAINFITEHVEQQPALEAVAAHVHLSPFHFQRLFCRWTGITPKRFLQVSTLERSKLLLQKSSSLLDISWQLGLSSGSRLYDHFVRLEAVTPGEYRRQGEGLTVEYGVHATPFGDMFVAVTQRGICRAGFPGDENQNEFLDELKAVWPRATFVENGQSTGSVADAVSGVNALDRPLSLYVSGTNFQVAVWRALLSIPPGRVVSYSEVARSLGCPRAPRAVGNAVALNPIAFLIPCHRVILSGGALGKYRWGATRKQAMQVWERARFLNE